MMYHNISLMGVSADNKSYMLEQLYPNSFCSPAYKEGAMAALNDVKTYSRIAHEFKTKPVGLYICYTGGLGTKSLRICGDADVLDKELIRGMKLSDFDGAPEVLARFFGINQTNTAEATPAYVNQ